MMGLSDRLRGLFGRRTAGAFASDPSQQSVEGASTSDPSQQNAVSIFASEAPQAHVQDAEPDNVELSDVPDRPCDFGYKIGWFAIRSQDSHAVADAFDLVDAKPANWQSGIAAARLYQRSFVFISPPVSGWVLAVGSGLPYPVDHNEYAARLAIGVRFDALMQVLMGRFREVTFFASDRRSDFNCWVRASDGVIDRAFCNTDTGVVTNRGRQSPAEQKLKIVDLGERSPEEATDYLFECMEAVGEAEDALIAAGSDLDSAREKACLALGEPAIDEDHTINMAAAWSVDPMALSDIDEEGLGLVGVLPPAFAG